MVLKFMRSPAGHLALETELRSCQLDDEAFPVHALQQSWSQRAVHFDRGADDFLGERVDVSVTPGHRPSESKRHASSFPAHFSMKDAERRSSCNEAHQGA